MGWTRILQRLGFTSSLETESQETSPLLEKKKVEEKKHVIDVREIIPRAQQTIDFNYPRSATWSGCISRSISQGAGFIVGAAMIPSMGTLLIRLPDTIKDLVPEEGRPYAWLLLVVASMFFSYRATNFYVAKCFYSMVRLDPEEQALLCEGDQLLEGLPLEQPGVLILMSWNSMNEVMVATIHDAKQTKLKESKEVTGILDALLNEKIMKISLLEYLGNFPVSLVELIAEYSQKNEEKDTLSCYRLYFNKQCKLHIKENKVAELATWQHIMTPKSSPAQKEYEKIYNCLFKDIRQFRETKPANDTQKEEGQNLKCNTF